MHQVDVSALTRLECLVLENIVPHYKTWAVPDNCRVSLQGGVDMLEHYASLRFGHPQQPLVSRMAQQLTGLHILTPSWGKPDDSGDFFVRMFDFAPGLYDYPMLCRLELSSTTGLGSEERPVVIGAQHSSLTSLKLHAQSQIYMHIDAAVQPRMLWVESCSSLLSLQAADADRLAGRLVQLYAKGAGFLWESSWPAVLHCMAARGLGEISGFARYIRPTASDMCFFEEPMETWCPPYETNHVREFCAADAGHASIVCDRMDS